jgi:hypothetical protein
MILAVVRFAAIVVLLWALPAVGQSAPAWLAALQGGGHVIVLRHGATYADQADTNPLDLKDTAHQRQLNDAGRAAAKAMGDALRKLKIPVAKVQTSLFHRAVETGRLLGFGEVSSTADLSEGGRSSRPTRTTGGPRPCARLRPRHRRPAPTSSW